MSRSPPPLIRKETAYRSVHSLFQILPHPLTIFNHNFLTKMFHVKHLQKTNCCMENTLPFPTSALAGKGSVLQVVSCKKRHNSYNLYYFSVSSAKGFNDKTTFSFLSNIISHCQVKIAGIPHCTSLRFTYIVAVCGSSRESKSCACTSD